LGQTAPGIRYLARTASGVIFITDNGITLNGDGSYETISYFIGRDSSKWVTDAPRYERLVRRNVYPGIDLVLYGADQQLEYDFVLAPHADPSRIRLKLMGARSVSIGADGALIVNTPSGELRHRKPVLMETLPDGSRRSVTGAFRILARDEVGFSVEGHNPALALSIDPVLESSTYFGGSGDDQVIGTDGNGTLVGMTTSIDVPGAAFARPKGTNLFVALPQQTIVIGCTEDVTVTSAAFSPYINETIAVGGYTGCTDLPTNIGSNLYLSPPLQANYGGGATDGFLLSIYLQYETQNRGGLPQPASVPSVQSKLAGGLDAFIAEIGTTLVASTLFGGSGSDQGVAITILPGGNVAVAGVTSSMDLPLKNPIQKAYGGGASDAFVAQFTPDLKTLVSSTYIGGSGADAATSIASSFPNTLFVGGWTSSTDFPTVNPLQQKYGGGPDDGFLMHFDDDGSVYEATYFGGSGAETGSVTLFFSSPGYPTATLPVTVVPTGAVFPSPLSYEQELRTNAGIQQLTFALAPLDPVILQPGTPQYLRPGANLSGAVFAAARRQLTGSQYPINRNGHCHRNACAIGWKSRAGQPKPNRFQCV
jgi:hypothetical protein